MKRLCRRLLCVALGLIAFSGRVAADYGLQTVAPWRAQPAKKFTVEDSRVLADGVPFPVIMDFTWSAPHDEDFLRYDVQLLTTAHWAPTSLNLERPQSWEGGLDHMLSLCQSRRIYHVISLGVQNEDGYISRHPEAAMMGPGGSKLHRSYACFLDPGYRAALGQALTELAQYVRDKPYVLGYYPQDEFSYPGMGGYNPTSVAVFRQRVVEKYGDLGKLNAAWGTDYAGVDDIAPPEKLERTRRWADWQEFRRWAYFDFCSFVYRTLKENDPNHLVIWSLDFWGSSYSVTNWWRMPQCADVLMRHGIGYRVGNYRFELVREIADWSGIPGNALAMPPGHYASYEHFSLLLDAARTGVSYVCAGGSDDHLYYRGAADSANGYRRREPGYTTSRSCNQLVYLLGDTYMRSKRREPQVGFLVGDRTVWVAGVDSAHVNGILCMLGDLNVDYQIVSEHNFGDLARFRTVIAGEAMRQASDETVTAVEAYVRGGGTLVLMPGAFTADADNIPVDRDAFAFFAEDQVAAKQIRIGAHAFEVNQRRSKVDPIAAAYAQTVVASTDAGAPAAARIPLGQGEVLAIGWDAGSLYEEAWTKDFTGTGEKEDVDAVQDNAYANMRPEQVAAGAAELLPQRTVAALIRDFARAHGVRPSVRCAGYENAIAAVRTRSFRQGPHYLVGIANRMVRPGRKFAETWPADYHVPLNNLPVTLALDEPASALFAVRMPLARPAGDGWDAMPALLDVVPGDEQNTARFTLPRVDDAAMVVVSPSYQPVLGAAVDKRTQVIRERVTLSARLLNPTTSTITGFMFAEGDPDALQAPTARQPFEIAAGGTAAAEFEITISPTAGRGYYLCQAVAQIEGSATIRSPSLEIEVIPAVEVTVAPEKQTIYPASPVGNRVDVQIKPGNPAYRGEITAQIEGAASFEPDARSKTVALDGSRDTYGIGFSFAVPETAHITELATLRLTGSVGGVAVDETRELRLAHGTVTYREERPVRLSNARPEGSRVSMVVLENTRVKAHIIPQTGVVHSLILRETNNDMFKEGLYPFGLVWYGWKGSWRLNELSAPGPQVQAALSSKAPDNAPVTMTISLGDGDSHVTVDYDTTTAGPVSTAFYLMTLLGRGGTHVGNVMHIPTKNGVVKREWRRDRRFREFTAGALSDRWLAVVDPENDQVFSVSYQFDALEKIRVSSGESGFNYMVFTPQSTQPPGRIVFHLAAQRGGIDEVLALHRVLLPPRE